MTNFMNEFWKRPGACADLSSPHAQQIQFAGAGSTHSRQQPMCLAIALQG